MIKQKTYLAHENSDQLNNLNIGCYFRLIFIPVNFLLKPDFNCLSSFSLSSINTKLRQVDKFV